MYPEILRLGPIVISSYGFMLVVTAFACYYFLEKEAKIHDWPEELAQDIVYWAALGAIAGAKIYYLIENIGRGAGDNLAGLGEMIAGLFTLDLGRMAAGIQNFGAGLVYFGSWIGGVLAVSYLIKKRGYSWLPMMDIFAPYLMMAYAIGRIGCFLVGDDYGVPSTLPWAMAFPKGLPPTTVPVHPTQIYEVILGFAIFAILYRLRGKTKFTGQMVGIYLILAGTERFLIEFIRTNRQYQFGLTGAQFIGMILATLGVYMLVQLPKSEAAAPS